MLDTIIQFIETPSGKKLIGIAIAIAVLISLSLIVKRIVPRYINSTQTRYRSRKIINFITYFFIILMIMTAYSNKLNGLSVFIGVVGAGVAFAMQEVIASVAGFIAINFSNFYKVGDRVLLGGIKGDVIDIGFLRTSLMEIGDWVGGDLYNGRITRVANSFIFKEPVYNYSGDFPFLWDEIKVPIRHESDIELATSLFTDILNEVQGEYIDDAKVHWDKMTEKLMLEDAQLEPMVKLTFDENWITFTLRYVVDYKKRRGTKDIISRKLLSTIQESKGEIKIATSSGEVKIIP